MTYRERREARAEKLREWAAKREANAAATFASHEKYVGDHAFNFQPGHIPERARVNAQADREFQSLAKARSMNSRAGEIESQLDRSIYSDDPDAIEQLTARIAELEAQREKINTSNMEFRKAIKAAGLPKVPVWQEADFQGLHQYENWQLSNLSGNIARNRQRLDELRRLSGQGRRKSPGRTATRAERRQGRR